MPSSSSSRMGAIVIVDAPELSSGEIRLIAQIAAAIHGFRASQISISCQSTSSWLSGLIWYN